MVKGGRSLGKESQVLLAGGQDILRLNRHEGTIGVANQAWVAPTTITAPAVPGTVPGTTPGTAPGSSSTSGSQKRVKSSSTTSTSITNNGTVPTTITAPA